MEKFVFDKYNLDAIVNATNDDMIMFCAAVLRALDDINKLSGSKKIDVLAYTIIIDTNRRLRDMFSVMIETVPRRVIHDFCELSRLNTKDFQSLLKSIKLKDSGKVLSKEEAKNALLDLTTTDDEKHGPAKEVLTKLGLGFIETDQTLSIDSIIDLVMRDLFSKISPESRVGIQTSQSHWFTEESLSIFKATPSETDTGEPTPEHEPAPKVTAMSLENIKSDTEIYANKPSNLQRAVGENTISNIISGMGSLSKKVMEEIYDEIRYKGFDPSIKVAAAARNFNPTAIMVLATLGAVRGSNYEKYKDIKIKKKDGTISTIADLYASGILTRNTRGKPEAINPTNLAASLPASVAFFLYNIKDNLPSKIVDSNLPNYLQFPAAAGIKMTTVGMASMLDFSKKFSTLINQRKTQDEIQRGNLGFNQQLFDTIVANARPLPKGIIRNTLSAAWGHFDLT